ncbi:hypothetical protein DXG01_016025 [Tephrocybe rancida]|nr:hypothetical protein DXG01_016025 [Tephrocybe rancida]
MEEARVLRDALASGHPRKERQQRIVSGEIPAKTRQPRSDKGKKRGPRKLKVGEKRKRGQGDDGEASEGEAKNGKENVPPQKKKRGPQAGKSSAARQLPPMPKSKEHIEDSSSDEES